MLGVSVGHRAFVQKWLADKGQLHAQLLSRIPAVQDAQSVWLLLMCAGPRGVSILSRPRQPVAECLSNILAVEVPDGVASEVVQLPFRKGGLGLRSASRLAPAAYWASWADCLSQVNARAPHVCAQLVEELERPLSRAQCVREAQDAATLLAREGMEVPEWPRFPVANFRAPQPVNPEVGQWTHGWQFHASVARDSHFATRVHLPPLSTDHQALRASQRGPVRRPHFQLRSSAHYSWSACTCPSTWMHTSVSVGNCWTCTVTLLKPRGTPAEVCMARICHEAGARVEEKNFSKCDISFTSFFVKCALTSSTFSLPIRMGFGI